jgi:hypothetical protein
MSNLFPDCPCNICLVQAACKESCVDEILWYSNLNEKEKKCYIEAGKYKSYMSKEAAEFVNADYNNYLTLLMRRQKK